MKLFGLFVDKAPNKVFISLLLSILAGIGSALLIPIALLSIGAKAIDHASSAELVRPFLSFEVSNYKFALLFALICLFILISRSISQIILSRVALDATTDLRTKAYRHIMSAPIAELEKLGSSKLLVAITTDVGRIITGATIVPNILVAVITLAGMMAYLFLLSSDVFWFVTKAIVFGIISYQIPMLLGNKYFERGRANYLLPSNIGI